MAISDLESTQDYPGVFSKYTPYGPLWTCCLRVWNALSRGSRSDSVMHVQATVILLHGHKGLSILRSIACTSIKCNDPHRITPEGLSSIRMMNFFFTRTRVIRWAIAWYMCSTLLLGTWKGFQEHLSLLGITYYL